MARKFPALKDRAKLIPSLRDEEPYARVFPALKYRAKLTPPLRGEEATHSFTGSTRRGRRSRGRINRSVWHRWVRDSRFPAALPSAVRRRFQSSQVLCDGDGGTAAQGADARS